MENQEEIWKDINGYEGIYQASNLGRVRSLDRVIVDRNGLIKKCPGKVLSPGLAGNGYPHVILISGGLLVGKYVHRLVGAGFVKNKNNKPQINHKDGDKTNNCAYNLEYTTPKENINHAWESGLCTNNKMRKRSGLKLSPLDVLLIRKLYKKGENTFKQLANKFSISESSVDAIINRRAWKNI